MTVRAARRWLPVAMAFTAWSPLAARQTAVADRVTALWTADDRAARQSVAEEIVSDGAAFEDVLDALKRGPSYRADVPTGRIERRITIGGVRHPYFFVVPESYDPRRRYPVRVYLHGGVRRPEWDSGGGWWRQWERLAGPDHIAVFPAAWATSPWWSPGQIENVDRFLADLKREYNIDENRVSLFGVSDGGSAVYYFATKDATRWSGFVPLIGHPAVLNNPRLQVDGEVFLTNFTNRPFFIANARDDRLYPAASMSEVISAFQLEGIDFEFHPQDGGHGVAWWPDEDPKIDAFLGSRARDPLPDRLAWETERTDRYHRFHWVRIDRIDSSAAVLAPQSDPFPHGLPAGRVDAERVGNVIRLATRDVQQVTLLLSPDALDFELPITVVVNGTTVFRGRVEPNVRTLLAWATEDLDRTMLFGAELTIQVP